MAIRYNPVTCPAGIESGMTSWTDIYYQTAPESHDHEEVERRRSDDGAGAERVRAKVMADDFDEWKQDFRPVEAEDHQRQVEHGPVPHANSEGDNFATRGRVRNLLRLEGK